MPDFGWIGEEAALSPEALTVRAQTIDPDDQGLLLHDLFFPRRDVPSVDLHDITTLDVRIVSDRRDWNMEGRAIDFALPDRRDITMVPVEAFFKIGEYEMQKLAERSLGAPEQVFRRLIAESIPDRTDELVLANFRRLEIDAMEAWANGQIEVKNPATGATYTASFDVDSSRLFTEGTAWDDAGLNAYDEFLRFMEDAVDKVGPTIGAMMRLATFKVIQADAPNLNDLAGAGVRATRSQIESLIQEDLGMPFRFFINENSLDVYDDAGVAKTRTKVWPANHVAAVPAGQTVGFMAYAPVVRAVDLDRQVPDAGIDIRGQTVWHDAGFGAKDLTVAAQVNAMPVIDEQKIYVADVGA